jgi:hypothetical protein
MTRSHKSVIVPYTRNQVSELERPSESRKAYLKVFGSIKKQTRMLHIYEIIDISLKDMFKELTMKRFDLS